MTLLEKPKGLADVPVRRAPPRFEWVLWVVLAVLIVAGITAGILLSAETEGVIAEEVTAELALDNHLASFRAAAIVHAPNHDLALGYTAHRVLEGQFPGRLEVLELSALRADQALHNTIERAAGN
jgi:hypothetical protein